MASVILLGPQRRQPTVGEVVRERGLSGPFALITAGWQEREGEDEELCAAIGGEAFNLELYRRTEELMQRDRELAAAIRERQERLRDLQELYRLRLTGTMQVARQLYQRQGDPELYEPERESAMEALRQLDRHHLGRVGDVMREHDQRVRASEREELMRARAQMAQRVHEAEAVFVAGGHVAVLFNRMRLFDLATALRHRPVIAWSAGAMVVSERIVLFHDSPPQGPGNAEVLEKGFALCRGVLPLPHASTRLKLHDPVRVKLLSRRFTDLRPVALDPKTRLDWEPPSWRAPAPVSVLDGDGSLTAWNGS